jgi:ABC-2 type transport system ATP-binding protein
VTNIAVEFENVSKEYRVGLKRRRVQAINGVSFRIERGETCALLGPNRAGKTTLVKVLLSLCRPDRGQVTRLGKPASDRSTLARVGYVHENAAFPRYLSAEGLLEYYGALTLLPYLYVKKRVPELLQRVGLADRRRDAVATFSKGMIQRLGLAQALLNDPELLVLDEPNEGLDLSGRQLVAEVVQEQKRKGGTVILVSHVLPEVEQLCDRVAVLREGRLAQITTMAKLTHRDNGAPRTLEQALKELYQAPWQ